MSVSLGPRGILQLVTRQGRRKKSDSFENARLLRQWHRLLACHLQRSLAGPMDSPASHAQSLGATIAVVPGVLLRIVAERSRHVAVIAVTDIEGLVDIIVTTAATALLDTLE